MDVKLPDGTTVKNVPEGMTQSGLLLNLKRAGKQIPEEWFQSPEEKQTATERTLGSTAQRVGAGMGKAFVDVARGARQLVGKAPQSEIDEARRIDQPLMQTTAGKVGNVLGQAAIAAPTAAIPGAGVLPALATGAGVGAGLGALQPTATGESRALNVGLGAAGGLAGSAVGKAIGSIAARRAAAAQAAPALAPKKALVASAQQEGYVLPPKDIPGAGSGKKALEALGGKQRTEQTASIRNQEVTNRLVKRELGLRPDQELNADTLKAVREQAGQSYEAIKRIGAPFKTDGSYIRDVRQLGRATESLGQQYKSIASNPEIGKIQQDLYRAEMDPEHAVELTKILRSDGNANLSAARMANDPQKRALGNAQMKASEAIEDMMERNLKQQGRGDLLEAFRAGRKKIAQIHDIAKITDGAGNVDPQGLVKLQEKGKPLSGDLKKVADFAGAYKRANTKPPSGAGEEGLTIFDMWGAGAEALGGHPLGAAAFLARPSIRGRVALGPIGQSIPSAPRSPSMTLRGGAALLDNPVAPALLSESLSNPRQ